LALREKARMPRALHGDEWPYPQGSNIYYALKLSAWVAEGYSQWVMHENCKAIR